MVSTEADTHLTITSLPRLSAVWWFMRSLLLTLPSVSSLSAQYLFSKVLREGYLSPHENTKHREIFNPEAWAVEAQMRANTINGFPVGKTRNPVSCNRGENPFSPIRKQNMSDHQVSNPHSSEVDGVWIALITFFIFGHFLRLQHPNNIPNSLKLPTASH